MMMLIRLSAMMCNNPQIMEEVENMLYQNDTITLDIPLKHMAVFDIQNEDIEK